MQEGVRAVQIPAAPRVNRRRYVTKRDLAKNGYIDECPACTQLAAGMQLMAGDDDPRQVE